MAKSSIKSTTEDKRKPGRPRAIEKIVEPPATGRVDIDQFRAGISALVAKTLMDNKDEPAASGVVVEGLCNALATALAIASEGNPDQIGLSTAAVHDYLVERTADLAVFRALTANM